MAIEHCPSVTTQSRHEMANFSASPCDPLMCCEHGTHPSPSEKNKRISSTPCKAKRHFLSSWAQTTGYSLRGPAASGHALRRIQLESQISRDTVVLPLHSSQSSDSFPSWYVSSMYSLTIINLTIIMFT